MNRFLAYVKRYGWIVLPLGFLIGMAGYTILGKLTIIEAIYATCALFFVNPVSDVDNTLVMCSKIIALLASAGFLLSIFDTLSIALSHFWKKRWADSTAVYCDNDWGRQLSENLKHGYIGNTRQNDHIEHTRCHIIMYTNDIDSIRFFQENRALLGDSSVYIMLNKVDSFLMDSTNNFPADIHFFNLYDMMARVYWHRFGMYDTVKKAQDTVRVAIVGYGSVGEAICKYAILNNLYLPGQCIEYHIWGCPSHEADFLTGINMLNDDSIVIHKEDIYDALELLKQTDRIIMTEDDNIELLQFLLHNTTKPELHCYPGNATTEQIYRSDRLHTFGSMDEFLSEECIKGETLIRMGKLINYDYILSTSDGAASSSAVLTPDMEKAMNSAWNELNGFTRGSNIARADHCYIEKRLEEDGCSADEMQKVEHIRWCRYHFYNRWTYYPGEKKDAVNRRHPLLVPYEELSDENKKKSGIASPAVKNEIDKLINRI